jgi:MFS family permease
MSLAGPEPGLAAPQAFEAAQAAVGLGAVYTLTTLVVAVTLAFLDRQAINLVVDAIRADAKITDTQVSLLQGAAFTLVYTTTMLPVAWASDRHNRKHIIIGSIVAWSGMTIAFGLARGFAALLMTRAGVALGEAGITPASVSIIRDVYPRHRQGTAISIMTLGVYIGGAISLSGGGPLLSWLQGLNGGLPGGLSPWRFLFIGAGALGVAPVAMLFFMREPRRERRPEAPTSSREFLRLTVILRTQALAYLCAYVGIFLLSTAAGAWLPTLFMRNHGWSPRTIGLLFGPVQLVCGACGALFGGWVVDRLVARGDSSALIRVVRLGVVALAVGSLLAALLPDPALALAANGLSLFGVGICIGLGSLGFQAMFPARFSGRGVAIYLLVTGVLGASIGPTVVPLLTGLLGNGKNVGPALGCWSVLAGAWSLAWLTWSLIVSRREGNSAVPAVS